MMMDQMRSDLVRGLVWFVNYAALDPGAVRAEDLDLHGTGMLPTDVELFAHRWLAFGPSVDIQHDGIGRNVRAVESFFNAPEIASPAFPINSHAARLDVHQSKEAMDGLRSGKLNSVSLDALTFNKVVRLPVATGRGAPRPVALPSTLSEWAAEIASCGYEGVQAVREVSPGLFVAVRSHGMPLAIAVDADTIEVSGVSDGPWAGLAAALFESPTLTRAASRWPTDHSPWDRDDAVRSLESVGVRAGSASGSILGREAFAACRGADAWLPHHRVRSGAMMTSRAGVLEAMSRLDSIPPELRPGAEAHLRGHLEEAT